MNSTCSVSAFSHFRFLFSFFLFSLFSALVSGQNYCSSMFIIVYVLFTYCLQHLPSLYLKKNIKNGSHGIIYIFKNYFIIIFSIFNKINCIQMDPKSECTFFTVLCLYFVQRFYNDNVLIFSCIYLYMMLICRRGFCHLTKAQG